MTELNITRTDVFAPSEAFGQDLGVKILPLVRMRPPHLEDFLGLVSRVREILSRFEESGFRVEFVCDADRLGIERKVHFNTGGSRVYQIFVPWAKPTDYSHEYHRRLLEEEEKVIKDAFGHLNFVAHITWEEYGNFCSKKIENLNEGIVVLRQMAAERTYFVRLQQEAVEYSRKKRVLLHAEYCKVLGRFCFQTAELLQED